MSIVLQSTSGGSVTINEPITASNFTQTLPAATGEIMVSGNMPAFSVSRTSSNQTITVNTFTKVQLNTEEFDTNNCFDSSTNYRFTPTVAGYYQINGAINAESSTGLITRCIASIYKNGAEFKRGSDINASAAFISVVNSLIYFNGTTDYVELYAFISATSAVVAGSAALTYFNGSMVRAA
jgi:hypothetical protein